MVKVKISNIKWDTDGEKVEGLPKSVTVGIEEIYPDIDEDIAEWLSDKYGFCHEGFGYVFITNNRGKKNA